MSSCIRLAHLSDIHFFRMDRNLRSLFSKNWFGIVNFFLRRKSEFDHSLLDACLPILQKKGVPFSIISGDISCTSSWEEFAMGVELVQQLEQIGVSSLVLPGNHDTYTRKALRENRFHRSFPSFPEKQKIYSRQLSDTWWLVALDTTLPTPPLCCHGNFSSEIEKKLEDLLSTVPPLAHIILVNHFPISPQGKGKALRGEKALLDLCKRHPNIRLYLHGHTHVQTIYDGRPEGLPILVDSGCTVHKTLGGWLLIECEEDRSMITPYQWHNHKWNAQQSKTFYWSKT